MIKPILKIELPQGSSMDNVNVSSEALKNNPIAKDYHVLVLVGKSDFIHVEIITASDISLHKD